MDSLQKFFEFLIQYRDVPISWNHIAVTSLLAIGFICVPDLINCFVLKKSQSGFYFCFIKVCLALIPIFLIIWLCGPETSFFALIFGLILSIFVKNKYFDFVKPEVRSEEDLKNQNELQRLRKEFKDNPHYSILEVLLYYGYISSLHKEYIETENIFKSPEEMAEELLTLPVLTERQLKEAKAIMNVIRMEGTILTKQDALLLIAKIEERRKQDDESEGN